MRVGPFVNRRCPLKAFPRFSRVDCRPPPGAGFLGFQHAVNDWKVTPRGGAFLSRLQQMAATATYDAKGNVKTCSQAVDSTGVKMYNITTGTGSASAGASASATVCAGMDYSKVKRIPLTSTLCTSRVNPYLDAWHPSPPMSRPVLTPFPARHPCNHPPTTPTTITTTTTTTRASS